MLGENKIITSHDNSFVNDVNNYSNESRITSILVNYQNVMNGWVRIPNTNLFNEKGQKTKIPTLSYLASLGSCSVWPAVPGW